VGLLANRIRRLDPSVRALVPKFRDELSRVLGKNLVGIYLHGSIIFPEYEPRDSDIDFHVVVRKPLAEDDIDGLARMHETLAKKFEFGERLTGFYIPEAKAQRASNPRRIMSVAHGRILRDSSDDAWPLHLENFHRAAYIRLKGPKADRIFTTADWTRIRRALYRQLVNTRRLVHSDPGKGVINLCRLIYNFQTGKIVIPKLDAARWAIKKLPSKWQPVIRSAIRTYKRTGGSEDRTLLGRSAPKFLGFASVRIIAFDTTWNHRQPHIAHLRKRTKLAKG
jgi:predicted nucleotidyltransferase